MKNRPHMVERVARAICKSRTCTGIDCCEWPCNGGRQAVLKYPNAPRCLVDDGRFDNAAKDAIAAMQEPTEAMLDAGDSMMPQIAKGEDITTGYDALKDAWPAMIDAALKEQPQ